jgi:predicted PurR-regulated permease PerM
MTEEGGAASRAALLVVVVAAAVTLIGALPLAGGLIAAPALAVICRPPYERLARRTGPRAAALVVIVAIWVALVVPGAWLGSRAIRQLPDAVRQLRSRQPTAMSCAAPSSMSRARRSLAISRRLRCKDSRSDSAFV